MEEVEVCGKGHWAWAVLAVTAAVALASCGDGGGGGVAMATTTSIAGATTTAASGPATTTTAPGPTTTTTRAATTEGQILADFQSAWNVVLKAVENHDPMDPALLDWYSGTALIDTQTFVAGLARPGLRVSGTVSHRAVVVSVENGEAVVEDCADDQTTQTDRLGKVVVSARGKSGRVNRMRLVDGRWRTYEIVLRRQICG